MSTDDHADPKPFALRYHAVGINSGAIQRFETRDAAEDELADLRGRDRVGTDARHRTPSIDFDPRY